MTRHTCTDTGKALPFGRRAPQGTCPRCDELHAGAEVRTWNTRTEPVTGYDYTYRTANYARAIR